MKTWEMLKELTENPKKRFRLTTAGGSWGDYELYVSGKDIVNNQNFSGTCSLSLNDDWEEVQTEVTWQEAIEAWANGHDIKSIIYGEEIFYKHEDGHLEDQNGDAVSLDELTEGKWYIL